MLPVRDWTYDYLMDNLARRLPGRLGAVVDMTRPSAWRSWGGPLNGQLYRRRLFAGIVAEFGPRAIIETGTYRGTTTPYLATVSGAPVYSVEASERFFHFSRFRLSRRRDISVVHGDSRQWLRTWCSDADVPRSRVFFYLDAHWERDLPLNEELELINEHWNDSVVMIDDFQVPGDPGYGFDDYGEGARLSIDAIPAAQHFAIFWPSTRSEQETGAKRGCVILATRGPAEEAMKKVTLLRQDTGAP